MTKNRRLFKERFEVELPLPWARKWRPLHFHAVVGQPAVVAALMYALKTQRIHHAYLFSGTRGVGKTSLARIVAKALSCEKGIVEEPCGRCDHCLDIDQGQFVDCLEIDAASRTGVDDVRLLMEKMVYSPQRGRFKIFIIDEVHMLSHHSFNALLKTLEEPPETVKFLLATTDPQKLPVTILSRCLHFALRSMTVREIEEHLTHILRQENIFFEEEAVSWVAASAGGSIRDALSRLEPVLAANEGRLSKAGVEWFLGKPADVVLTQLFDAVLHGDWKAVLHLLEAEEQSGRVEAFVLFRDFQAHLEDKLFTWVKEDREVVETQRVQAIYEISLSAQRTLPYAPTPWGGVKMAFLRLFQSQSGGRVPPSEALQDSEKAARPQKAISAASWPKVLQSLSLRQMAAELKPMQFIRWVDETTLELGVPSQLMAVAALEGVRQQVEQALREQCRLETVHIEWRALEALSDKSRTASSAPVHTGIDAHGS